MKPWILALQQLTTPSGTGAPLAATVAGALKNKDENTKAIAVLKNSED